MLFSKCLLKKKSLNCEKYFRSIGQLEIADILIRSGAKVNAVNIDGNTPLHLATHGKGNEDARYATVVLLAKNGADIDLENRNGRTPKDVSTHASSKYFLFSVLIVLFSNVGFFVLQ